MLNTPSETTPVPNLIFKLFPTLKDTELRVLLVITRQTLGWVQDLETGARKIEDWISQKQLKDKTGRAHNALSQAIEGLVDKNLIEVKDENGQLLNSSIKRRAAGNARKKFYYRLSPLILKPENSLSLKGISSNPELGNNKNNVLQKKTSTKSSRDVRKTFKRELLESEQILAKRITEWCTRSVFDTYSSQESVQIQVENCIIKYGYLAIKGIFDRTANTYQPHPRDFWNEVKSLKDAYIDNESSGEDD